MEFSNTKIAAFGSSSEQTMNRELKDSLPSLLSTATQSTALLEFPGNYWVELGLLGQGIAVLLNRTGPEQEQMGERELSGEWILAAACSAPLPSSLNMLPAKEAGRALLPGWHLPELDYTGSRWHGSTWLVTIHSTPKTSQG